ncbi:MAG TPA: SBBP repeat-containing protein, partial [Bacteroidia bacterium]|nr:SBBP repeat-containing protein [Bacteroidia bacterium]
MKKFLLIACSLQAALLSAQTFGWAVNHGSSGNDVPRDIATDAAGNVYTVGYFNGTVDFDPGAGSFPLTSLGGQDIFITKLDPSGNLLWAGRIGGAGNEQANGIALDASANMHITGCFYGTVDFDPGAGVFNSGNMTGADIYVLKLTSTGGFVWFKQMGGTNDNQQGNEIAVDAAGNVYSTGQSIGVIDFDPGPGTAQLGVAFSGNTNFYVSKLDINGLYVWAKVIGNSSSGVYGMDIAVNAAQEVYTCGYFIGTVDFDPGTGTFSSGSGSANNCFVHKYTSVGNFSFMKRVGTGNIQCEGYAMVKTASNIYVTGYSYGTSDLDPGTGTVNHISAGLQDVFILSLDNLGIYQWSKQIGGTGQDYGYSIATDALGAIYTTGTYEGTVDFDPGAGSSPLTSANVRDVFISKLQSNGNYAWGFSIGGTGIDVGQGIAVSPAGSVYTTGFKSGTGDYDPTAGTFNLAHGGGYDAFVQKMAQCLTPVAPPNTTAPAALIVCSNNSTTLTATGFGTLGWYSAPSGGTYLGGGSSFSTPALTSNTTYYVQDSLCAAGTRTTITVSVSPAMTPSLSSVIHVSCNGGTDGMATVGVTGGTPGFTYLWSPSGGTAATASSLAANSYTCTITDAAGCTTTQTVSITQPTAITSSVSSQTNILCNGANTGAATINASGGTGVLTYSWSPSGGTAASISGRTAGIYTCTITDANSCTHTQTVNITQPSAIVSSLSSQTNISCNGGSDGAATVSVTGG